MIGKVKITVNELSEPWLPCNGSAISQALYPELYALVGATTPVISYSEDSEAYILAK